MFLWLDVMGQIHSTILVASASLGSFLELFFRFISLKKERIEKICTVCIERNTAQIEHPNPPRA